MVNKIACFLTCGYTEAGAMQAFLRKMNSENDYKQYLPNKTIKKKGMPKRIHNDISGLTGEKLLDKVYDILLKHREEIGKCKAVLIEDDLDGRFHKWTSLQIGDYCREIVNEVRKCIGIDTMPVWILYASPEIESWFIADWEHGFKHLFCEGPCLNELDKSAREYYSFHLKQYIEKHVLAEYVSDIESYGWFDGKYFKLSIGIIEAIETGAIDYLDNLRNTSGEYIRQIKELGNLRYSKNTDGDFMLRNIVPEQVAEKCFRYFRNTYFMIRDF